MFHTKLAPQDPNYSFKTLFVGQHGVGKSSLLSRYVDDTFAISYLSTIGVDFKVKTITIHDKIVKLQIWDTTGPERFRTITSAYYRGAHGILLVYESTEQSSFDHVDQWRKEIEKYANENVSVILVGAKCDLPKIVSTQTASEYASNVNIPFFETSSKNGDGVEFAFNTLSSVILSKVQGYISFGIINDGKPIPVYVPTHEAVKRMVIPLREFLEKLPLSEVPTTSNKNTSTGTTCLLQ